MKETTIETMTDEHGKNHYYRLLSPTAQLRYGDVWRFKARERDRAFAFKVAAYDIRHRRTGPTYWRLVK